MSLFKKEPTATKAKGTKVTADELVNKSSDFLNEKNPDDEGVTNVELTQASLAEEDKPGYCSEKLLESYLNLEGSRIRITQYRRTPLPEIVREATYDKKGAIKTPALNKYGPWKKSGVMVTRVLAVNAAINKDDKLDNVSFTLDGGGIITINVDLKENETVYHSIETLA